MGISIIIVNYNVKYFLEQCLYSVIKASEGINSEIIVVDNASTDGSIEYLQPYFPRVKFMVSKINLGFAKANNLALKDIQNEYVLFLNPDTIIPENCLSNCINFFEQHNDCGALGVKMLDGSGKFLPESKRSFPSLTAAFFKLTGLSAMFPKSKLFNKYALGHLPNNKNFEIDVLAGAFLMMNKKAIEYTKGFDETFFMYGEDVDLSYRVQQSDLKNYYFGEQSVIHFKGESTKRGSLNYVRMFYNAMALFVKKHYRGSKATLFSTAINFAIWFRAFISLFQTIINKTGLLIFDALVVFSSLYFTKYFWINFIRDGKPFEGEFENYALPIYTVIFIVGALLSGIYDNLYKPLKAFIASLTAVVVLLAFYSLLPESSRFSRGVILTGGLLAGFMVAFMRWLFIKINILKDEDKINTKQTVVVGTQIDYLQVLQVLQKTNAKERIIGRVGLKSAEENSIGNIDNLLEIIKQANINEVVFCEGTLKFDEIIHQISFLSKEKISFKFHAKKSHSIVGSDSKTSSGEIISADGYYLLNNSYQLRMKRMVDIWVAIAIILTIPFQYFILKNFKQGLENAWLVLIGKRTWIGYSTFQNTLPLIEPGILLSSGYPINSIHHLNQTLLKKADTIYARNYEWMLDLKIIYENYRLLGGK